MNKSFPFFVLFQGTGYGLPGTRGGFAKIGGAFTHLGAGFRCALAQRLAGTFCCGFLLCGGFADGGVRFCGGIFLLLGAASSTVASTVTASAKIINRFFMVLPSFRFYSARRRRVYAFYLVKVP